VGLILDSSVVITAERRGHTVRQILEQIQAAQGQIDIGLSVVTIAELMHGAYRAKADADKQRGWPSSTGCAVMFPCILLPSKQPG
jgi:predicted nucleic acid-binding protein